MKQLHSGTKPSANSKHFWKYKECHFFTKVYSTGTHKKKSSKSCIKDIQILHIKLLQKKTFRENEFPPTVLDI